jgi:Ni/Co efflux regulator RcnB
MKKIMSAIMATALLSSGAAMAAPQSNHDNGRDNHGQQVSQAAHHKFTKGEKFDRSKAPNYRQLDYHDHKRLSVPPKGYKWVQSGDDALLIGATSGIVSAVVSNFLR